MNGKLSLIEKSAVSLRPVPSLHLQNTMGEAARQMYMSGSDALLVVDDSGYSTVGVITSRDVVAVVAENLDPDVVTIAERLQSPRCAESNRPLTDLWFS